MVVVDLSVSAVLCFYFRKMSKTRVRRSDTQKYGYIPWATFALLTGQLDRSRTRSVLRFLMIYIINTALLTGYVHSTADSHDSSGSSFLSIGTMIMVRKIINFTSQTERGVLLHISSASYKAKTLFMLEVSPLNFLLMNCTQAS